MEAMRYFIHFINFINEEMLEFAEHFYFSPLIYWLLLEFSIKLDLHACKDTGSIQNVRGWTLECSIVLCVCWQNSARRGCPLPLLPVAVSVCLYETNCLLLVRPVFHHTLLDLTISGADFGLCNSSLCNFL